MVGQHLYLLCLSELHSIFPHAINGHGFLTWENIRDFTTLRKGPHVHPSWPLGNPNIDSNSYPFHGVRIQVPDINKADQDALNPKP